MRRASTLFVVAIGLAALVVGVPTASAHRSGCHGKHTCPSDASPPTYRCGDNASGTCNEPNDPSASSNAPKLSGPPTASDCRAHPEYYTPKVCAFAGAKTPAPTVRPPAPTARPIVRTATPPTLAPATRAATPSRSGPPRTTPASTSALVSAAPAAKSAPSGGAAAAGAVVLLGGLGGAGYGGFRLVKRLRGR